MGLCVQYVLPITPFLHQENEMKREGGEGN